MAPLLSLLLLVLAATQGARSARILAIIPTASISHQRPCQALMRALAERGHQVTIITTDPFNVPIANYTEIDISFIYEDMRKMATFAEMSETDPITMFVEMTPAIMKITDDQLSSKQIQDFLRYNASQGYDLVILEWMAYQAYFGVVHAVGSPPLVGIVSFGGMANAYNAIGNPNNPAYNPEVTTPYSDNMNFWERIYNTYIYLRITDYWQRIVMPGQEEIMRKHFGSAPPPVHETESNMSLLLLNNHWSTEYPRALLPNVVQLTGLHVRERPQPLPAALQEWLDGAHAGLVYFSLGSNVMSKDLPPAKRDAVLKALGRLPQRVLWKWEDERPPGCPDNVRVAAWLPQQDVLAHPNVRLFITQGGLQSFQEAAYHAVPLLAVPFMGDQHFNAAKMVAAGVGERLLLSQLTEETLYAAMRRVLVDDADGYAQRMRRFSAVFREHKAHSLDTALWWVEYVLRHRGAPHMRAASLRLAWYQLLLLDVVAAGLAALLVVAMLAYLLARAARALWRRATKAGRGIPKSSANGISNGLTKSEAHNVRTFAANGTELRKRKDQ